MHIKSGFTLIELLVVITIIGILMAIALPNYIKAKDKVKEAEVKSNIHAIQIALERYAVDNGSEYPPFLLGGDSGSWNMWHALKDKNPSTEQAFNQYKNIFFEDFVVDPLIFYNYMSSYPSNPFIDDGNVIVEATWDDEVDLGDPRFGYKGDIMGNGLTDPKFFGDSDGPRSPNYTVINTQLTLPDAEELGFPKLHYMMGGRRNEGSKSGYILTHWPGNFFYRSGWSFLPRPNGMGWGLPGHVAYRGDARTYMLGAYGSNKTSGYDVIRLESTYSNDAEMFYGLPPPWNENAVTNGCMVGEYLPSDDIFDTYDGGRGIPLVFGGYYYTYGNMSEEKHSSSPRPSYPYENVITGEYVYGCPDGCPDGVILVLLGGGGAFKVESQNWAKEF